MHSKRNYPLLLASQFLGALGDNMILTIILGQLTTRFAKGLITEQQLGAANAVFTTLLFIPYFLFAPVAGFLNDRYAKTSWLAGGNAIKLLGTLIAGGSLMMGQDWQGVGYFIVGIGSCFYSPAKYGILPEILPGDRLVKANGTVEMLTLVAILSGSITGAQLIDRFAPLTCYAVQIAIYGLSLALNLFMARTPSDPSVQLGRSVSEFVSHGKFLLASPRLCRVLLNTTLFWICGAVMKMNFQPWGLKTLGLKDNTSIALLGLWLSIGIMAGSMAAGQLHQVGDLRRTRTYGWILGCFVAVLSLLTSRGSVIGCLVLTGISAGLFLIPLNAALQAESPQSKLGKTIAVQNFLENLAMSVGGGVVMAATKSPGVTAPMIFTGLSVLVFIAVSGLRIPQPGWPNNKPASI